MSKTPQKRAKKQAILPESKKPNINDAIRALAHLKWESAGCPEGDGTEFWYEAEREILTEESKPNATV